MKINGIPWSLDAQDTIHRNFDHFIRFARLYRWMPKILATAILPILLVLLVLPAGCLIIFRSIKTLQN